MATYYINADSGDDGSGDGSEGNPWLTLAQAYTQASDNDTIILQDSTANFTTPANQHTWTKSLTVQGEQDDGTGATIAKSGVNNRVEISGTNTFEKLTFTHTANNAWPMFDSTGVTTFNLCRFVDCKERGSANLGIIKRTSSTLTITNCVFLNTQFSDVVTNSSVIHSPTTVTGCLFIWTSGQTNIVAYVSYSAGGTWKNNIIANYSAESVDDNSAGSYSGQNNCWYNITSTPGLTNDITTDPLLVDPDNGNYNLRPTSPCIGTGVDL